MAVGLPKTHQFKRCALITPGAPHIAFFAMCGFSLHHQRPSSRISGERAPLDSAPGSPSVCNQSPLVNGARMTQAPTPMIDFWKSAIRQQFHAAIDMLANAIQACPDSVWSGEPPRAFWYIAFHTLFFLDMYLAPVGEAEFRPPPPSGLTELADGVPPERTYTKDELLAYLE